MYVYLHIHSIPLSIQLVFLHNRQTTTQTPQILPHRPTQTMPRILILGATGYVGSALATTLLRSSHRVYGLARTPAKANSLARLEIIPVNGSIQDSDAYIQLIKTAHIDVVVDCSGANQESFKVLSDVKAAGKERLRQGGAKLGFVYTSGTWVHGSSDSRVSDLDPVGTEFAPAQPPRLVKWRPEMERDALAARDVLDVMVVRPALIYGRESAIWASFFGPVVEAVAKEKGGEEDDERVTVKIPLNPMSRPALVHVDDVAQGLQCAVEKLPLISGTGVYPVFDLMTSQESMRDIFDGFGRAVGLKGRRRKIELVQPGEEDLFAEAMQTSTNGDSSRAETLLGWSPKKRGFVAGMDVYANAFKAAQQEKI